MIETALIIDTETTGLNPEKGDKLIEVAAVLYSIKYKSILQCYSTLLPCETNPVEHINHIKAEATKCNYPVIQKMDYWRNANVAPTVLVEERLILDEILSGMCDAAHVCVAHNAEFDKNFIKLLKCSDKLLNKKWICTQKDFKWPFQLYRFRLQDICFACRIPYANAHRALNDCILLAQCFSKVEDLETRFN